MIPLSPAKISPVLLRPCSSFLQYSQSILRPLYFYLYSAPRVLIFPVLLGCIIILNCSSSTPSFKRPCRRTTSTNCAALSSCTVLVQILRSLSSSWVIVPTASPPHSVFLSFQSDNRNYGFSIGAVVIPGFTHQSNTSTTIYTSGPRSARTHNGSVNRRRRLFAFVWT